METLVLTIVIAAAFSIALGKALDAAPLQPWMVWAILAAITLVAVLMLKGVDV